MKNIGDYRFEGYSDEQLADQIKKLRGGNGAAPIGDAVDAVRKVIEELNDTENELRTELGKLGVAWQSKTASQQAQQLVRDYTQAVGNSPEQVGKDNNALNDLSEQFSRTKHSMPEASAIDAEGFWPNVLDIATSSVTLGGASAMLLCQAAAGRAASAGCSASWVRVRSSVRSAVNATSDRRRRSRRMASVRPLPAAASLSR